MDKLIDLLEEARRLIKHAGDASCRDLARMKMLFACKEYEKLNDEDAETFKALMVLTGGADQSELVVLEGYVLLEETRKDQLRRIERGKYYREGTREIHMERVRVLRGCERLKNQLLDEWQQGDETWLPF